MKTRSIVALAAVAGFAAAANAQDHMTLTWSWVHIQAGTTTVITPAVAGKVSENEGVEFRANIAWGPQFGTIRTSQATGISGPIEGFAKAVIDFDSSGNSNGYFHNVLRNPGLGGAPVITPDRVGAIQLGQFGIVGSTINTNNPLNNVVRIRWTPNDWTERTVVFTPSGSPITQFYGELYINFGGPQGSGEEIYTTYRIDNSLFDAGAAMAIEVIPSPASVALLGLGGLIVARRRR
jgi:hypothetical protein